MRIKRQYLFFVLVILLITPVSAAYAQSLSQTVVSTENVQYKERWTAGASFHTGALMNHHNYMSVLSERNPWIVELYFAKKTYGEKPWQSFFGNPDIGAKFTLLDIGSPTYIGKTYTLHPFVRFYLTKEKLFRPSILVAAGPAYVEKIFDRKANYKNAAIGSHINAFLQLQADVNVRITPNVHIFAGLSLSHLSNGSFKKPNAGANVLSARLGASYNFGKPVINTLPIDNAVGVAEANDIKWSYRAILSGGVKEISPIGGSKYGVGSLSFETSLRHLAYTRFNGSLDMFYDGSDYDAIKYDYSYDGEDFSRFQTVKLGLAVGYELLFGKVSANVQMGAYLFAKYKESTLYQRFTVRYMATNHIGIQFGLKSHNAAADYIELGCIYKIK